MLTKNTSLREVHCEMNEIHLQGFSAMVNAMEKNETLLYLPRMDRDRAEHVKCLKDKLFQPSEPSGRPRSNSRGKKGGLRKLAKGERKVSFADEVLGTTGAEENLHLLEEKWESEAQKLLGLLVRNAQLQQEKDNKRFLGISRNDFLKF